VDAPLISIGIPTVDRLAYLREAVASAQAQHLSDLEILIADDGKSPDLRDWASHTAASDHRVRYLKTPQKLGLSGAWNFLADSAAGEFIAIIGDDDRLLPGFADRLHRETSDDVAVVFANHYVIDASGRRLLDVSSDGTRRYGRDALRAGRLASPAAAVWRNSVPMSACIVRTSVIRRLRFRSDVNTPEIELFARLSLETAGFVFVPEYLAEYRSHARAETAAGLTLDRLAEYLEPIDVPPDAEPAKRACLAQVLSAGVGMRIARGDMAGARQLSQSRYYGRGVTSLAQRISLGLPDVLAPRAYIAFRGLGRLARGFARTPASRS
jgi:glycosyltransferase involved in cell wall biosynthesis